MLVETNEELRDACAAFPADAPCAVDVEFIRRTTYYPIVALIQMAIPGMEPILADTISLTDLDPIRAVLLRPTTIKILHAGSQDLEALDLSMATLPDPFFDSQIAAAFCGLGYQISFADIVERCLGRRISKRQQLSDWLQRPLRQAQLQYAEQDVEYLLEVYEVLVNKLAARGRMEWVQAESRRMLDEYRDQPERGRGSPERIRGAGRLLPRRFTVLSLLTNWREELARKENCPPRWIVKDGDLLAIAERLPGDPTQLAKTIVGARHRLQNIQDAILNCVERGLQCPSSELLQPPDHSPPDNHERQLSGELARKLDQACKDHEIAVEVVATRREIKELVRHRDLEHSHLLQGWRRELVGDMILEVLKPE